MKNRKDNAINSIAPSKKWIHLKTKVFDKSIITIPITNPATTIDNRKKNHLQFPVGITIGNLFGTGIFKTPIRKTNGSA